MKEYFRKPGYVDINTTKRFRTLFYEASPQPKREHTQVKALWDNMYINQKHIIIKGLRDYLHNKSKGIKQPKINMTCLEYLKKQLELDITSKVPQQPIEKCDVKRNL